jgi:hypothetical protein
MDTGLKGGKITIEHLPITPIYFFSLIEKMNLIFDSAIRPRRERAPGRRLNLPE